MKIRTDDGTLLNTAKATAHYEEETYFDGNNHISSNTGSQWTHEELYRSSKGRWYLYRWSQWQGSRPSADFIDDEEAAGWLELNGHAIPDDLASVAE